MIREAFTSQQMCAAKDRSLNLSPKWKGVTVKEFLYFATDGAYWRTLQCITPLFQLINYIATFMEGDAVPFSYVTLSFVLINAFVKPILASKDK